MLELSIFKVKKEYVHRFIHLNKYNLNAVHKRKNRFRLYHIVEDDFVTTVTTKWKQDFRKPSTGSDSSSFFVI